MKGSDNYSFFTFSPNGKLLASLINNNLNKKIAIWNINDQELVNVIEHKDSFNYVSFTE